MIFPTFILSFEAYEQLVGRFELYGLLQTGLDDISTGRTIPADQVMHSETEENQIT